MKNSLSRNIGSENKVFIKDALSSSKDGSKVPCKFSCHSVPKKLVSVREDEKK
jgi:hypothetical protein